MWVMHGFDFRLCLCLCLCLSLSLSLSSGLQAVVCLPIICLTVEKFIFYIVFSSDRIRLGFLCFLPPRSRIGRKLLLIIFIFWQISSTFRYERILCAETPFFHFEESLSTDNIRWVNALVGAISCNHYFVCTINWKEISFGPITLRDNCIWTMWTSFSSYLFDLFSSLSDTSDELKGSISGEGNLCGKDGRMFLYKLYVRLLHMFLLLVVFISISQHFTRSVVKM